MINTRSSFTSIKQNLRGTTKATASGRFSSSRPKCCSSSIFCSSNRDSCTTSTNCSGCDSTCCRSSNSSSSSRGRMSAVVMWVTRHFNVPALTLNENKSARPKPRPKSRPPRDRYRGHSRSNSERNRGVENAPVGSVCSARLQPRQTLDTETAVLVCVGDSSTSPGHGRLDCSHAG